GSAAEVELDVVVDREPAKDPLAIGRALAGDGRLKDARRMDRLEGLACAVEEPRRGDHRLLVDRAVLGATGDRVLIREVGPGEPEDRLERQPGHPSDGVEVERGPTAARDDGV